MSNDSFHDAIDNDSKETHASSERPMRIWSPAIPHYTLDERHIDGIVKQFVQKIETGAAEPLDPADDPMYASLEYGMDIRMVDELKDQFECVELRKIDLLLLKECNRLRRETEKLMVVYYQMIQVGEKDEEGRKLLLLLLDYIRGRKVFLERNEEIRERINLMLYNSEKGWNYLKACQHAIHYIYNNMAPQMKKENILRLLATLSPKEMESIFDRCTPEDRSFAFSVLNECIAKTESLIIQSEIDASNSSQMINLYLKRLWACVPEDMKSGLAPFFENYSTVCEEAAQK